MPLVYQQNINATTKIGVWHITEDEDFFLRQVPLHRKITHWHKRLQHLAGRLLLRELYPEFPLGEILIADTKRPFLENQAWHFSISHSGDYAAVIASKVQRVGVDVELADGKVEAIRHKFISDDEMVNVRCSMNDVQLLTLCWGVKESVFKWWGNGGVDFKKDIVLQSLKGDEVQGAIKCLFKNNSELDVHYLHFNNNFLTWVIT
ncbi:MAG TPA: 4'-phosphopantetheinyl transferase superfamily protein [Ferruginibacter sp.]|nr:4'-phosphopantetheinyl transferase superfamily protein [Ferruginibacter sp.]